MLKAIDQAIRGYSAFEFTVSWCQGGVESFKNANNNILWRIAACVSQILVGIACFFLELLILIPGKFLYTLIVSEHKNDESSSGGVDSRNRSDVNDSRRGAQVHHDDDDDYDDDIQGDRGEQYQWQQRSQPSSSGSNDIAMGRADTIEDMYVQRGKHGVMIPMLNIGRGLATSVSEPWGFKPLSISNGIMFRINIHSVNPDGSVPGKFTQDEQLMAFQKKYNVEFPLLLSKEHSINLPVADLKAAGIPEKAKAFQFIYPGSLNMKFTDPSQDTPANREFIIAKIQEELRSEMQQLLLIGGYLYYAEAAWKGDGTRDLAGINVLVPGGDPLDQNRKQLYFGQAKIVTQPIVDKLADMARKTDGYYGPTKNRKMGDYPAMCKITVGPLLEKGLSHFKWLEPGNELIKEMQKELKDEKFGAFGVFIYYSKEEPSLSCMLPITSRDEWKALMRNTTYLEVAQTEGGEEERVFESDKCEICFDDEPGTLEKLVLFNPCRHMCTCLDCYSELKNQGKNKLYRIHGGQTVWYDKKPDCPICRTVIDNIGKVNQTAAMKFKPHTDLGNFQLKLADLDLDYVRKASSKGHKSLNFLLEAEQLRSPISLIPENLKKALKLPKDFTHCSFLYPMYGRGMDFASSYIGTLQDAIKESTRNARVLEGLVANGGFVFYGSNNPRDVKAISAILPGDSIVEANRGVLNLKTQNLRNDTITAAVQDFKNPQKEIYNASRITLQGLLPFARYFQWTGNSFAYYQNGKKEQNWEAVIVV